MQRLGLPLLAVVRGFADAQQSPEWFTTAPAAVVPRALRRAGVEAAEVGAAGSLTGPPARQLADCTLLQSPLGQTP